MQGMPLGGVFDDEGGHAPMPRLDRLPQANRSNLETFPAQVNDTAPFAPLRKPLAACRLAIVTTAGLHRRGDRPFSPGEQGYRVLSADTPAPEIIQSHTSLGFDRAPIMRDLNVTYPIDRLRELVARGELGAVAPSHYSFMGALRDARRIEQETGPEVAARLRDEGVDAVLVTPT
ncbi:MAG TPA: glycine/sarcosine/betaine reductase selenoprotein B family protein [Candidatus Binatia bacterium]|nr:glycine/sarcosine/betaine reductase selenoprotein B family protein [Candidatus Binatia bacterium]